MTERILAGLTDNAAEADQFQISNYTNGLVDYIRTCYTPITVSIQGSWGTGKTSFMNLMRKCLFDDQCIWFNTWQYSQFDLGESLPTSLMGKILKSLALGDNGTKNTKANEKKARLGIKKLGAGMLEFGKLASVAIVDRFAGDVAAEQVTKALSNDENGSAEASGEDMTDIIENLRTQFQDMVNAKIEFLKETHPEIDRLFFFIDDLDRLAPSKAVELLEVMKLFLDCENCVFILAIDHEVVYRGVAQKYGLDYRDKSEAAKGKSFFDKIIQVPFSVPVAEYNLQDYVKSCLEQINITYNESDLGLYVELTETSIGRNPRSMKRLFNQFLLLTKVKADKIGADTDKQLLLFAVLCMQHSYDELYGFLLSHSDAITAETFETLRSGNDDTIRTAIVGFDFDGQSAAELAPFMSAFYDALDRKQKNGKLDDKEINNLRQIFNMSSITSAVRGSSDDAEKTSRKQARYSYHGVEYISGSRSGYSIGDMGREIVKNLAVELKWGKTEMENFRKLVLGSHMTNWLQDVIMYESDILNLESNYAGYKSKDAKSIRSQYGFEKTLTFEDFVDHFWCYLSKTAKKPEDYVKDADTLHNDKYGIRLYDGTVCFVARWWGYLEIEKLRTLLKENYDYNLEAENLSWQ